MASSSETGQLNSMTYPLPQRLCRCKEPEPCVFQASNNVTNPERRYYYCRRRGRCGDCKYWDWVDPELSGYYKDCFLKIKLERDLALEELIRQRKKKEEKNPNPSIGVEEEIAPSETDDEFKQLGIKLLSVEKRIKLLYLGFALVALLVFFGWV